MKTLSSIALLFLSAAPLATAHAIFSDIWVDGVDQNRACLRPVPSNSPVESVTSNDLRCNVGGTRGMSGICDAKAGGSITVEMHQQPNDRSCANEAIGGNHFGPVMVYMSKVDDATSADGSAPWFKVDEFGYDAATKTWGTDLLNKECGKRTFKVPSNIPAGNYLVRAEAIALHTASQTGGAQFYMSCFQVNIAGSSGGQLPAGVSIPGAYNANDPGIKVNIWDSGFSDYKIPGPAVIDTSFM
ncbi:uncharacterized protein PgNI_03554 [Pyricularia grisea]|uniref:lytic cellulose monooxygenase (C4-dehydrogenating) n=1 Tax=Pyricularia grisea TaxID=148305 RepID=A0A6P8BF48_PYRGI|nr:uncharacterized protein PgNI_03554 [Pyricularia grisea]TLD14410.1 hypothetical protein PgNI_03554 [Pyricularia grisea]